MTICVSCGNPIGPRTDGCPRCGQPRGAPRGPGSGGQITALLGGMLLALGVFLPWVSLGKLSANGLEKTDNEALILVGFGALGALMALTALAKKKNVGAWVPLVTGLLGFGVTAFYYSELWSQLAGLGASFDPMIDSGIYVCMVGALIMLLGGLSAMAARHAADP